MKIKKYTISKTLPAIIIMVRLPRSMASEYMDTLSNYLLISNRVRTWPFLFSKYFWILNHEVIMLWNDVGNEA